MENHMIVWITVCIAVIVTGAAVSTYELYHIVKSDAEARDLKHPRLWSLLAVNGNNSSGLLAYLIGRRKYPCVHMTTERRAEMEQRKKRICVSLTFQAVGAIGLAVFIFLM